ncbi:MAG TPA: family 16 glycoside hydrolase [Burkholderiales bacterium]|nr:family 16 glycoside hydrolase [Burkholderiales bacterium]
MPSPRFPETSSFSKDVIGRYVCNGLDEAILSGDPNPRPDLGRTFPRSDARPFDVIILGGGTFGSALAQHLFSNDVAGSHRILVLEAGPFVLPEHTQNLPMIGLGTADPTSLAELRNLQPDKRKEWEKEVWGLAWHSNQKFPGLAYCIGGRSLYWGGWSPMFLDSEVPTTGPTPWPATLVNDLKTRYFKEASDQIGVSETNDFIYGPLHSALRQRLFEGLRAPGSVPNVPALGALPDHPAVLFNDVAPSDAELVSWLGLPAGTALPRADLLNMLKLEAPLAVQSQTAPGQFPNNKFSAVPLLIKAARAAQAESQVDDVRKRLMIVPNCHVIRLGVSGARVSRIETSRGNIDVAPDAAVVIALATIESTRLALESFRGIANYNLVGRNLMAHLRSNLTIRIARASLPAGLPAALSTSALFVKGRAGGRSFHLQISASGVDPKSGNAEAELWQKIPDIDTIGALRAADDQTVVITIRAIGEMEPQNTGSFVRLDSDPDLDFGAQRAFVELQPSQADKDLWNSMDQTSDAVAAIFANGRDFEVLTETSGFVKLKPGDDLSAVHPYRPKAQGGRRDGLGTTHHEAGTLWMGEDPASSVTNSEGRFHHIENAYVAGPALLPSIGSPNPMLSGVAMVRRLADTLIPPPPRLPKDGSTALFDGTEQSFQRWKFVGGGRIVRSGRALVAQPGNEIGLLYYPQPFGDFTLLLDFMLPHPRSANNDNSGIFVRFQDPAKPVADRNNPAITYPYGNQAFVAVDTGFEIQIDEEARGQAPLGEGDGLFYNRTGAIYKIKNRGTAPGSQDYQNTQVLKSGQWNHYEISITGQTITVKLNGQPANSFENDDAFRGRSPGYIGLQVHTGRVAFANVRLK